VSTVLFDTSVLVAHCVIAHPHRVRAQAAIMESKQSGDDCYIALHSLAETFAVLSSLPVNPRISSEEALFLIEMEILCSFIVVPLSIDGYRQAMAEITRVGRSGGAIYDALILQAARSINSSRLYTFNEKHFRPLLQNNESLKIICP